MSVSENTSLESMIFRRAGEFFAAGMFENKNAPIANRYARAIRRYLENAAICPYKGRILYPCNDAELQDNTQLIWKTIPTQNAFYEYSYSFGSNCEKLKELKNVCKNNFEKHLLNRAIEEMEHLKINAVPQKYSIGGNGYTHSIINYKRIIKEGLNSYLLRIEKNIIKFADDSNRKYLLEAMKETLQAIINYHARILSYLKNQLNEEKWQSKDNLKKLINAFEKIPLEGAESFYEAVVSFNFMWNIDGGDSIGRFDQNLFEYYNKSICKGEITDCDVEKILNVLWQHIDSMNGWHMIIGGSDASGKDNYTELTYLCLKTLEKYRRPNTGIRISPSMPDKFWDRIFDNWQMGAANPCLYNEKVYNENITELTGVKGKDVNEFSFGGCTELMFQGMSNIGSIDAGLNLLDIFENTLNLHLISSESFENFLNALKDDIIVQIRNVTASVNVNQHLMATYRPQLIRTLFIDDCIDNAEEFNAGGARYNGAVINVAGMTNTVNSLFTVKKLFEGKLKTSKEEFLKILESNYEGFEAELSQFENFSKFGNAQEEVDCIAAELSEFIFKEINRYKTWRGKGFFIPSVIMFTTYENLGTYIGATPEGRLATKPIADSAGAMQGTDLEGPTSLFNSCVKLQQKLGIGTLVMNLRITPSLFKTPEGRNKLKSLIKTYFDMGGLQIQVTVADNEILKKAMKKPESYPTLMIRIGGYSEYFNRLTPGLQQELIKRTAHNWER